MWAISPQPLKETPCPLTLSSVSQEYHTCILVGQYSRKIVYCCLLYVYSTHYVSYIYIMQIIIWFCSFL